MFDCNINKIILKIILTNMATAIKAIPTLYGEDAIRFREEMDKVDLAFDNRPYRDIKQDQRYAKMKKILSKAKLY